MRKILIVIDMQNDFVSGSLGSPEAQAIVPNVVEKVKNWNGDKLYFTRDTHFDNYMNTLEGQKLPVIHCIKDTKGWRIIPELNDYACNRTSEVVCNGIVDKVTFGYKRWDQDFTGCEEFEFELCGLCTDICVISNALALRMFYPDAKITVDASCCAGVTPEKHAAALEVMKSCQIDVINE